MAGNANFDTIASATIHNYRKTLVDNLIDKQCLLWKLKSQGFISEDKGGTKIVQPLMYGSNATVASYQGYDLLDVSPSAGITSSEYVWKYLAGSVVISGQEEFENSGDSSRIFNLLDAKLKQLETSFKLEVNQQLFSDGTGNSSKDITGLALAVEDGTAWSTYGGIDSDANTWWRNQWLDFDTYSGGATTFGVTAGQSTKGLNIMRRMFNLCSVDGERPDLIVTTQDLFEAYESVVEGKLQLAQVDTKMADAGFMNVMFKKVPILWDSEMTDEGMLFLNSKYLKFVVGKGRNFTQTPFIRPQNQDAKVSQLLLACQLVTSKRDVHGRISAMTE